MKNLLFYVFLSSFFCSGAVEKVFAQKQGQQKTDSLFTVLKNAKAGTAKVNALNELAYEFRNNNPDTAIYFANEALTVATKMNYKKGNADAYLWKGRALSNLGKYDEALINSSDALKMYDQILTSAELADKSKILKQKAWAYNTIGLIYREQSNYSEALKSHVVALKIREQIGDKEGIAASYVNIGSIYYYLGNYSEALKNYFATLKLQEEIGNKKGMADPYNNIGIIYCNQSNYPEALKNYYMSLKIREEIGDKNGIASAYNNIGNIYYYQSNFSEALKNHFASLKISEEIKDKRGIGFSYANIGNSYYYQGNYPEALKNLFHALRTFEEIGDKQSIAASYINIGDVHMKLEKYKESSSYLNKGLTLAKEVGSITDMKASYSGLAKLDSSQGKFKQALEHYKLFIANRDSLFNEDNTKKLVQSQMQYDFDKKESLAKAGQEKKDAITLKEKQRQKLIRNGFVGGFTVVLLFAGVFFKQRNNIKKGKKLSDELLLNILPSEVAEELKRNGSAAAKQFDDVTVMFTDFKNFTQISEKLSPAELVAEIHYCFKEFDNIITRYNIEKIKTIGDSYMCAGGLPVANKTNPSDVVNAGLEIQQFIQEHLAQRMKEGKEPFEIRIGIHTGPVVAGIVGIKKFAYDIWGDTVNIASRLENSGEVGKVNISGTTYELVKDKFKCTHRGKIAAKNKGMIDMYFVNKLV